MELDAKTNSAEKMGSPDKGLEAEAEEFLYEEAVDRYGTGRYQIILLGELDSLQVVLMLNLHQLCESLLV